MPTIEIPTIFDLIVTEFGNKDKLHRILKERLIQMDVITNHGEFPNEVSFQKHIEHLYDVVVENFIYSPYLDEVIANYKNMDSVGHAQFHEMLYTHLLLSTIVTSKRQEFLKKLHELALDVTIPSRIPSLT